MRFDPVGKCIYCGTSTCDPSDPSARLTDEHIVPKALGGDIVLREASCLKCKYEIGLVEDRVIQKLESARLRLRLGRGQGKKRTVKLNSAVEGVPGKTFIALDKIPHGVALLTMHGLPGLISLNPNLPDSPAGNKLMIGFMETEWWKKADALSQSHYENTGGKLAIWSTPDSMDMARLIAKIGHSYICKNVGYERFVPFLTEIILGKTTTSVSSYIGGQETVKITDGGLHIVSQSLTHGLFWTARIHLFTPFIGYEFYAVVGVR